MFHQVMIRPEDRQAQRFLFDGDVYVMDCAIFGATCSPSTAMYIKDRNASEFAETFADAAEAIVTKHYVDDYYDSAASIDEAVKRASEVKYIHSKAGFELRHWVSNSIKFLNRIGEKSLDEVVYINEDKVTGFERVLGIVWNPSEDMFSFSTKLGDDLQPYIMNDKLPTKRIVLSCVMRLFDPLGFLATFTIQGKILIQDLWRSGCDWDEVINEKCAEKWKCWVKHLPTIETVKIPRYYFGNGKNLDYSTLQLHLFVDASENAYGCVAYFRMTVGNAPICSLVQAKSKVAPLKPYSIPRLELMAAVLGARMCSSIKEQHSLAISKTILWSDSKTVCSWISSEQRKYKPFVAFRVAEILNQTNTQDWRWLPTRSNIADDLTKWKNGSALNDSSGWFTGPSFFYKTEQNWPTMSVQSNTTEEIRASFLFHNIKIMERFIDVTRFSKWNVLVRTVATVLRFISNLYKKQRGEIIETLPNKHIQKEPKRNFLHIKRPLSTEEFQKAERYLWKVAQSDAFPDEIRILKKCKTKHDLNSNVDKSSILYKLSPIIDEFDVIRMDGRIGQTEFIPFETCFPVILPKGHPITVLLIEYYHCKLGHANREAVVNELRRRFYIPQIRVELKKVMKNCICCKLHKCKPKIPRMASLPKQRVTPYLRPFSFTGVDYFGPVIVTVGRRSEKRWIALFTCLTTRAVQLEVTHSLSTPACIMAIRRFVCKRGVPLEFFSDNGTNFIGASKQLARKIDEDCSEVFTDARTKWNFIPPLAPHMGGAWERLVRSVKQMLEVLDDGRKLTDEILLTTLAEAEDIINSRPLTYLPQESSGTDAITPNHFLRGVPYAVDKSCLSNVSTAEALRDSFKRSQLLANEMWKRWLTEYVPSINQRAKWHAEQSPLEVGEIVYLADSDNRKCWVRGIVEQIIKGKDGRVRQAIVRTTKGLYRRPAAKIAVPEIRTVNSSAEKISASELQGGAVKAPQQ